MVSRNSTPKLFFAADHLRRRLRSNVTQRREAGLAILLS
jgi:hypothetical protein